MHNSLPNYRSKSHAKALLQTGLPWLLLAIMVIAIDRYSKLWVLNHLQEYEPLALLPFFNLTLAFNKGAAFGFLHKAAGWQNFFFCNLALIICIVIIVWLYRAKIRDYLTNCALSLIIGGAVANVIDRIIFGHVIDFFDFHVGAWHFAIFNVADSAICIGAGLMILHWLASGKPSSSSSSYF